MKSENHFIILALFCREVTVLMARLQFFSAATSANFWKNWFCGGANWFGTSNWLEQSKEVALPKPVSQVAERQLFWPRLTCLFGCLDFAGEAVVLFAPNLKTNLFRQEESVVHRFISIKVCHGFSIVFSSTWGDFRAPPPPEHRNFQGMRPNRKFAHVR